MCMKKWIPEKHLWMSLENWLLLEVQLFSYKRKLLGQMVRSFKQKLLFWCLEIEYRMVWTLWRLKETYSTKSLEEHHWQRQRALVNILLSRHWQIDQEPTHHACSDPEKPIPPARIKCQIWNFTLMLGKPPFLLPLVNMSCYAHRWKNSLQQINLLEVNTQKIWIQLHTKPPAQSAPHHILWSLADLTNTFFLQIPSTRNTVSGNKNDISTW